MKKLKKEEKLEITFKQFRNIAKYITVECPSCGDMFLLSEAKFQLKAEKIKSWLEKYNKRMQKVMKYAEKLDEREANLENKKMEMENKILGMKLKVAEMKKEYAEKKKQLSRQAIARSKGVKLGYYLEEWIPYFKPLLKQYNPCDYKYLGKPVDFIVFKGMEEKDIKEIVFLEAKSKSGSLSKPERQIKNCIEKGKTKFKVVTVKEKEIKIDDTNTLKKKVKKRK